MRPALRDVLAQYQARVDRALDQLLPAATLQPTRLHQAMRYSTLNGGKRFRPTLVYATAYAMQAELNTADAPACAVELIHAYSLIHDDLPAMDNDDLRRGQPTCHKQFDDATAILAGDALQTLAFQTLTESTALSPSTALRMIDQLARAAGSRGMVGGQAIDLAAVGNPHLNVAELENMHIHKTGALIRTSVLCGALCAPTLPEHALRHLDRYAMCLGLAFQIHDDILDVTGATEVLGKPQGSDIARNKPTYPAMLGLAEARRHAQEMHERAVAALAELDALADPLRWLAEYVVTRDR